MDYVCSELTGIDMDATLKKIGQLIKESGLSDKKLGEIMGLSVQSINKWRHGRNLPDIENLFILSRIFGIKVDDFFVPRTKIDNMVIEMEPEAEAFSASAIRRLWAYLDKLRGTLLYGI